MSDTNPIAYKNEIIRQQAERIERLESALKVNAERMDDVVFDLSALLEHAPESCHPGLLGAKTVAEQTAESIRRALTG